MSIDLRKCKACGIETLSESNLFPFVEKALSLIAEEDQTGADEYEKRVQICAGCPYQEQYTCMKCGCLTAVRAAKKKEKCPLKDRKW